MLFGFLVAIILHKRRGKGSAPVAAVCRSAMEGGKWKGGNGAHSERSEDNTRRLRYLLATAVVAVLCQLWEYVHTPF